MWILVALMHPHDAPLRPGALSGSGPKINLWTVGFVPTYHSTLPYLAPHLSPPHCFLFSLSQYDTLLYD